MTPTKKKATKKSSERKPQTPKEAAVVFAFRLTAAERDLIHEAAGPQQKKSEPERAAEVPTPAMIR